uniref:ethanolamine-phosphate cytidylyltransferase n=1 Tax=Aplanochytrium stocchinoi TaxID=215587 RepID=A0A7S3V1P6_9STRA|mmetsp:Transcript_11978/g.13934  ORF Transcript_11978/g.13934 Transcript_11978/m.13934 type:complete len:294 (+) Transcript_11978:399-1280(+)
MVDALKKGDIDWTPLYKVIEESSTMQRGVLAFHGLLRTLNVPTPYPDAVQCVGTLAVAVATLILYYLFFGKRHVKRRKDLLQELAIAQEKLHELEVQLAEAEHEDVSDEEDQERKEKRVFLEGAFDLMHYGHMNAFRQARAWGTTLIVGVNDDASIEKCKGTAPIMNNEERMVMVESCKWVDETILGVPYIMTAEYLDKIVREYKIDYVVHGDDPCIVDGKDVYELPKRLGMFRSIPRTEGVSTTDIVGRMLYLTREHHDHTYKAKRRKDSIGSTGRFLFPFCEQLLHINIAI